MLATCLLLTAVATAPGDVIVQPLAGSPVRGSLATLTKEQLVVNTDGGPRTFPLRDLLALTPAQPPAAESTDAALAAGLADGSVLRLSAFTIKDRQVQLEVPGAGQLATTSANLQWVRLRPADKTVEEQWRELLTGKRSGDLIVIRKSDTELRSLEGVFRDVDPTTVNFKYDDAIVPVDRKKVEGLIFFHTGSPEPPAAMCQLVDAVGNRWHVAALTKDGDQLQLETVGGVSVRLPWNRLQSIDFSSGNVAYLSNLDWDSAECKLFVDAGPATKHLEELFSPKRDRAFDGGPLMLGDTPHTTTYTKGLALHSRTLLTYRLTQDYRRLVAIAGIDSRVRQRGHVELVITGDDQELLRVAVTGKDEPLPIDLDMHGVRRLRILVDYGLEMDIADHLNLCDARLIK